MEQIFNQARRDVLSTRLITPDTESYIFKGIKILKDESDSVRIYNTKLKGDYYSEVTPEEYKIFDKHGWRVGCCVVITKNNRKALNIISEKMLADNNKKNYIALSKFRETIINRYLETITILNNELNGKCI